MKSVLRLRLLCVCVCVFSLFGYRLNSLDAPYFPMKSRAHIQNSNNGAR